jgi:CBS domain-containing protein
MTQGVQVIAPDVPGFEALLTMTRLGVHHLPVVDRGRVLGVVTTTDLVRHQGASTVYLGGAVRRSGSIDELVQATTRLPEMQVQMVAAGATPRHLGQAVGAVVDALTRRLLQLAEAELGPPPCPYAWLAFGSQARHEQSVLTDQDNGLLIADEGAGQDAWFERLARFVNDGLHACGFARCPGDVMASNPTWRQPLRGWRQHFDGWIERPESKALMHASIFFDLRAAAGDESLALRLQTHFLSKLRGNEVFLALLTANAIRHVPPLGFFRGFVLVRGDEHADTLDLKRGGMMPIVELARIHALAAGSTALGTVERLREAAERHTLSGGGAEDLEDALAFVSTLRARHQADQIKRGLPPDNHVRPGELSPLERSQLKDAFAVVRRQQEALAQVYRARSFV